MWMSEEEEELLLWTVVLLLAGGMLMLWVVVLKKNMASVDRQSILPQVNMRSVFKVDIGFRKSS